MKPIVLFASLFFASIITNAQTYSGKVVDQNQNGIEGVAIYSPHAGVHVHTNKDGSFTIDHVHEGDSLQITHLSYNPFVYCVLNTHEDAQIVLTEKVFSLEEVMVSPDLDALSAFTDIKLKTSPVNSSQEILRKVPGLVIGQHAGGGKAEQIFLRGFDTDHGTDINITVDGLPVNMVSHAHGQGYADLHFVIPESIENLNFGKGPYSANQGNFTTAGFVAFKTRESLQNSIVKLEVGQYNTQRILGMFNVLNNDHHAVYIASEYLLSDGPFESPQNFSRFNLMAKYTGNFSNRDKISIMASLFTSNWDASGQIPQRAVNDGSISRFGAIDDTEGGQTGRNNVLVNYNKHINKNSYIKNTLYYSTYDFELYSNFTFFLHDSIHGDQIKQKEERQLFGLLSEFNQTFSKSSLSGKWQAAVGYRDDKVYGNELSHTVNRLTTLDTMKLGDVDESNLFAYVNADFEIGRWVINPSLRLDHFKFMYNDHLADTFYTQVQSKTTLSPKLNILFNPNDKLQIYLKGGKGFHSNDTRVVVAMQGEDILPAAWGSDLGFIWKPIPKLLLNVAVWYLYMEQEFVYVGDEAVVEPSGETRRLGIDFSSHYQLMPWLYWDLDINYAYARAIDEPKGEDYIPLAPDFTIMTNLNMQHKSGVYGGIGLRYIADRPANEDNSIVALGYTVVDLSMGYQLKKLNFGFSIQNLFNTEWNETQFATTSRLQNEPAPVEEINFTPGTPFFIKGSIAYKF